MSYQKKSFQSGSSGPSQTTTADNKGKGQESGNKGKGSGKSTKGNNTLKGGFKKLAHEKSNWCIAHEAYSHTTDSYYWLKGNLKEIGPPEKKKKMSEDSAAIKQKTGN